VTSDRAQVARDAIRAARVAEGRRTAVLDDDPTGSQSVHDVTVVAALSELDYHDVLSEPGATCFILTNTRSMAEPDAVALNREVATQLFQLERETGAPVDVVSRGDSTLRGHVIAEVQAIDSARREVLGVGYDGVLIVPAYFEAGRFTVDDIHFAIIGGVPVPVGESEFARDATFGYAASNLREFVAEKSGGAISPDQVLSISLDVIREGGPERVAEVLMRARDLTAVVVNAEGYDDLEVVVLALQRVEAEGRRFLFRSGPSFVRALIGLGERPPLTAAELWGAGTSATRGLVVVGSHVGQTARQLARAMERFELNHIELSVPELLANPDGGYVGDLAERVRAALANGDVMFTTSRTLMRSDDPVRSLEIASTVSTAVTEVVRAAVVAGPSWVLAKGGITSHDVAVRGLGIRRATVLGQFFSGMVSALRIDCAIDPRAQGIRYVVFAGNVGDDDALAEVIDLLRRGNG